MIPSQPPSLCPGQVANYTITFTDRDSNEGWEMDSYELEMSDMVEISVTEIGRFQLDNSYTVTVTITTEVGEISSSAIFGWS